MAEEDGCVTPLPPLLIEKSDDQWDSKTRKSIEAASVNEDVEDDFGDFASLEPGNGHHSNENPDTFYLNLINGNSRSLDLSKIIKIISTTPQQSTCLPTLSDAPVPLHQVLSARLHSYQGFKQRRPSASDIFHRPGHKPFQAATHGSLGTTPAARSPNEHSPLLASVETSIRREIAPITSGRLVQQGLRLQRRIADSSIDRATPLEFDVATTMDRLVLLDSSELQAWKATLEQQINSLSTELIAILSQRDRHLYEQSVRSKLVECILQVEMQLKTTALHEPLGSSTTSSDELATTIPNQHLVIPYRPTLTSRDLLACEAVFRMLDAWQQRDDARLALLQAQHLEHLP
eukprot:TRINITY_DN6032_c0_g1_i2.p1 TRINITY_DN6032_c0_g1~~TRINITY_DN6032_c0_g1_i2.p1  ORF type:complete len:347 (+),score=47.53 TRINITY_DN6032_c0_g1_i2:32-1072(+)